MCNRLASLMVSARGWCVENFAKTIIESENGRFANSSITVEVSTSSGNIANAVLPAVLPKFKLLDLYSCSGGAGYGYEQAGFDVVGIDIAPQPKHRGKFIQADAIEYLKAHWHEYDAVHASPPCQAYSMADFQKNIKLLMLLKDGV